MAVVRVKPLLSRAVGNIMHEGVEETKGMNELEWEPQIHYNNIVKYQGLV
jgi:hypothetical protein